MQRSGRARRRPHVAVLVDTATGWGRRMIEGIAGYAQKNGPWHLWIEPRGQDERLRLSPSWRGQGIIARISTPRMARELAGCGIPVVNISSIHLPGCHIPTVTVDYTEIARLAVAHFLDRGYRHFGYCGLRNVTHVRMHYGAFAGELAGHGHACHHYTVSRNRGGNMFWQDFRRELRRWVRALPKPLGLLTWSTNIGRHLIEVCREAGIAVPEEVAILGGDDDPLLCNTVSPPLSGIVVPSRQIGARAAALLEQLMRGRRPPSEPILIKPTAVATRQSTDALVIDDADVLECIRFIRAHAYEPITVRDVLRAVPVSRRSIEKRFLRTLGRTPAAEIRRMRIERVKELLEHTDLPMPQIAAASGFGTPEYMSTIFKKAVRLTPLKYRTQVRAR